MGIIRKQSVFGAINLYLGQGLGMLNKVLLFPLAFAGQEEYWGLLAFMMGLSTLLGGVSSLGFSKVIQRFVPVDPDRQAQIIRYSFSFIAVGGVLALAMALVFKDAVVNFSSSPELTNEFYALFIALLLAQIVMETGTSIFSANFKTHWGLFASNVSVRIGTTILLLSKFALGFDVGLFIALIGGLYLINHLVMTVLAFRLVPNFLVSKKVTLPYKRYRNYAVFMVLLSLVSQSFLYLDGLLVGHFLVLSQLAVFDLTKNIGNVMDLPSRALGSSALPTISRLMEEKDLKKIQDVYTKGSFVQLFVGLFLFAAIAIHLDLLLEFFYKGRFDIVKPLFLLMFLGKVVDMATGLNWAIITNSAKYWANLIIGSVVLVVVIALEWFLIPKMGLYGAVLGIVIALVLNNALRSAHLWSSHGLVPFGRVHLKLFPLLVLVPCLVLIPVSNLWVGVVAKDLILIGLVVYYLKPGRTIPEIEELFLKFVRK